MFHLPINLWGQFKLPSFQTGSMPLFWRLTIFETWSLSKVSSFRRFSEVLPRRFVASPVGSAMPSTASHCKCRINFPNSYEFHALFKKRNRWSLYDHAITPCSPPFARRDDSTTPCRNLLAGRDGSATPCRNLLAGRDGSATPCRNLLAGRDGSATPCRNLLAGRDGSATPCRKPFVVCRKMTVTIAPANFIRKLLYICEHEKI